MALWTVRADGRQWEAKITEVLFLCPAALQADLVDEFSLSHEMLLKLL